jgi:hypothetical protein
LGKRRDKPAWRRRWKSSRKRRDKPTWRKEWKSPTPKD